MHIERRYLKLQEWVAEGKIKVKYIKTDENRADSSRSRSIGRLSNTMRAELWVGRPKKQKTKKEEEEKPATSVRLSPGGVLHCVLHLVSTEGKG